MVNALLFARQTKMPKTNSNNAKIIGSETLCSGERIRLPLN